MQGDQQIDQIKKQLDKLQKKAQDADSYNFEYYAGYIDAILDVKKFLETSGIRLEA